MKNFKELIDYMKEVRRNTPDNEPNCDVITLRNGRLEVFKLSHTLTANIILRVSGKQILFQIEEKENGEIAVYPPDGADRSTKSYRFNRDDDISCLKNLKADAGLIDILIENITNLH